MGIFADGLNTGIYLARGDYLNASLSSTAMLPVIGQVSTGTKLGAKGVKVVGKTTKVTSQVATTSKYVDPSQGFTSFRKLKQSLGPAPKNHEYHHIVEQCQIRRCGFDPRLIHNPGNIIPLEKDIHKKISSRLSSKGDPRKYDPTMRLRDHLTKSHKSFDEQFEIGSDELEEVLQNLNN